MLTLNDGRAELWQWDTGRTLNVDADCSQVHFSNKVFGRSIDVDVVDGVAIIPDIMLQTDKDLNVWSFVGTAENGYTKISKTFKVNRRNKPADYVFTPTDQMTLQTIQSQIGDLADLTTEAKDTLVAAINEALTQGGGTVDPEAVQQIVEGYLAENPPTVTESDPTVPAWAKAAQKPSYTASEVGADPSGTAAGLVAAHNTAEAAHNDIRLLISGLTDRINALADSDDTTLDQMSEVVAYIKSNKSLIDAITTSKVSVSDIVNDLVTNVADKPLSAAQGVALKALIDAITIPTALPNPNALTFTGAVTGSYDGSAPLNVEIPSGGGAAGGDDWELILDTTIPAGATVHQYSLPKAMNNYKELFFEFYVAAQSATINICSGHVTASSGSNRLGYTMSGTNRLCGVHIIKISDMALMINAAIGSFASISATWYSGLGRMLRQMPTTENFTVLTSIETTEEKYLRVYGVE